MVVISKSAAASVEWFRLLLSVTVLSEVQLRSDVDNFSFRWLDVIADGKREISRSQSYFDHLFYLHLWIKAPVVIHLIENKIIWQTQIIPHLQIILRHARNSIFFFFSGFAVMYVFKHSFDGRKTKENKNFIISYKKAKISFLSETLHNVTEDK